MATAAAIEESLGALPFVERIEPERSVWRLRRQGFGLLGGALEPEKSRTLDVLGVARVPTLLVYSEDPVADDVPGQWERVDIDTWRVPADVDPAALVSWLHLGGWMMYSAPAPVDSAELLSLGFAPEPKLIAEKVRRLGLRFLVVSFHDDLSWTIAIWSA